MTKTLNQIIFLFLHQNQNIFFSNIGNQNIFLEQNHDYHDYAVCDLLEYGWPVGHLGLERNRKNFGNNQQRTQFVFPNVKTINAAVKTHTPRCLRSYQLIFLGLNVLIPNCEELADVVVWDLITTNFD
jgi:hypothetical protein